MSGSRWVITTSRLSGSLRSFLYSSSVYSCHHLISSASVRSIPFLSFLYCTHLCMKCSLDSSSFLEELSSFSHYFFPLFLCIDHWGKLFYLSWLFFGTLHWNGYIFPFLLLLLFFSQLFVRPPQTIIFLFCILFLGDGLDHCLLYNIMNLHP